MSPVVGPLRPRVLMVDDGLARLDTALGRAADSICAALAAAHPARYGGIGMHELGGELFEYLRANRPSEVLNAAYETLPVADMTPREAYERMVDGEVELVPSGELPGRTAANAVMPYPPGIPMLMSGENFGAKESPQIEYLKSMENREKQFPGFSGVIEGAEMIGGVYHVLCVQEK